MTAPITLAALAKSFGGVVDPGAERLRVNRVAPLETASSGDLAPLVARRFGALARESLGALLVDAALASLVPPGRRWIHPRAPYALACLLETVARARRRSGTFEGVRGRSRPAAYVHPKARIHSTARIRPGAVIEAGAVVGPRTEIGPNAVICGGVVLGANVLVGAGAVIGSQGFGWTEDPDGRAVRIPQLGGVRVEDDVEIGPLCTIDAGTLVPTVIGRGAKLDAHVHVGHNVTVGPGALVAAQVGFAGSARIGAGVRIGGQAGVADHVRIGDGARLAAKAGVIADVPPGVTVAGYPAVERTRWLRATARSLGPRRPKKEGT